MANLSTACVRTGLDRLLAKDCELLLSGRNFGLIANATCVDSNLRSGVDSLAKVGNLRALFGPEHGLRGAAQDMISVECSQEGRVPVYSLYGHDLQSLTPSQENLQGLDLLLFDIQDVGSRYYTYVWTMVLAMRACAEAGVAFAVLDRPNPIGGQQVEGGWIAPGYDSFVGLRSLPNRHGLTAGEIAKWALEEEKLDLDLQIVKMQGWTRDQYYTDTGLPWVQPSPNMPTVDTAIVYPGMCLVEGTELSEGRGQTRPFEVAGAAYIDAEKFAHCLNSLELPGVFFRPVYFEPTFHKFSGQSCGGVQQHVLCKQSYNAYLSGVAFLWAAHKLYPEKFAWREKAYEFVEDIPAIDLLAGSAELRKGIEAGASLQDLQSDWAQGEREFLSQRESWLLY